MKVKDISNSNQALVLLAKQTVMRLRESMLALPKDTASIWEQRNKSAPLPTRPQPHKPPPALNSPLFHQTAGIGQPSSAAHRGRCGSTNHQSELELCVTCKGEAPECGNSWVSKWGFSAWREATKRPRPAATGLFCFLLKHRKQGFGSKRVKMISDVGVKAIINPIRHPRLESSHLWKSRFECSCCLKKNTVFISVQN